MAPTVRLRGWSVRTAAVPRGSGDPAGGLGGRAPPGRSWQAGTRWPGPPVARCGPSSCGRSCWWSRGSPYLREHVADPIDLGVARASGDIGSERMSLGGVLRHRQRPVGESLRRRAGGGRARGSARPSRSGRRRGPRWPRRGRAPGRPRGGAPARPADAVPAGRHSTASRARYRSIRVRPVLVVRVEVRSFAPRTAAWSGVQPAVAAAHVVVDAGHRRPGRGWPAAGSGRQRGVVADDGTAVPQGAEVLAGVEAEAGGDPRRRRPAAPRSGPRAPGRRPR